MFEKIKVFLKNQKHEPNIVEVTHLCIMHRVHTSNRLFDKHVLKLHLYYNVYNRKLETSC